jgi:hypothetical protein
MSVDERGFDSSKLAAEQDRSGYVVPRIHVAPQRGKDRKRNDFRSFSLKRSFESLLRPAEEAHVIVLSKRLA